MRRRRNSIVPALSLFPFLAVLICTFGVLIILLVIVVKAASAKAEAKRYEQESDIREKLLDIESALELEEVRVQGLRESRPEVLEQLQDSKTERAHLQAEIDRLTQSFKRKSAALAMMDREMTVANQSDADRNRLGELQIELEAQRQLLGELKKEMASRQEESGKVSVVPYRGPNGTKRHPIYLECTRKGIVLQPFRILLTQNDFIQPVLPNNPLDAALVSVREYYLKNEISDELGTPYPLLIVRPDGPQSYAMARHAMKSWDEEFGYELIPAAEEIDFGEKDILLEKEMLKAIEAARSRQNVYLVQQARSRLDGSSVVAASGLEASPQHGGFVSSATGAAVRPKDQASAKSDRQRSFSSGSTESKATRKADIEVAGLKADGKEADVVRDNSRSENWGLPSKTEGAIGYRRPIKCSLSSEQIVFQPVGSRRTSLRISLDHHPDASVEKIVNMIWQIMDSWGVAGANGYWIPELEVNVMEDHLVLRQLELLLLNSGIDIKESRTK
ncbi:MAG: hypothetical protein AAGA30_15665 [Planctomycetota bacterium]